VDALRYYLMRNMVLGQDSSFSRESFIKRYNADLANDYGNVINRITILIEKNFNSLCPEPGKYQQSEHDIIDFTNKVVSEVDDNMKKLKIHDALANIFSLIREINKYLEIKQPWKLIKIDKSKKSDAATSLYISAELLRISSVLLIPYIPEKATLTLSSLSQKGIKQHKLDFGQLKANIAIKSPGALFPRIEE